MIDQYKNGEPAIEVLSHGMLERKLATCAFGESCLGTFIRADGNGILTSMLPGGHSGLILPAREIATQSGVSNGRIIDAGHMSAMSAESFIGSERENFVMLEHFAEENGLTPEAIKTVLTIFGREMVSIVDRQSGLKGAAAGRISRDYTKYEAEKILGEDVLVILKNDPTVDEIVAG